MGNNQHVVADGTDFGQNMGAEDNGVFLFQAFDQIADFVDLFWVKADSRLIQNNNLRVTKHSLRNTNPLSVTFGKVLDQTIFHVGNLYHVHDFFDHSGFFIFRNFLQICYEFQIFQNGHIKIKGRHFG